ncbi:MAG: hypothetical protein GY772_25425 [bacterium]|nr:hypothetical protein [bacterium]
MRILALVAAAALLSGCDQDRSTRQVVSIEGRKFAVYQMRNRPDAYYAEPASRAAAFSPFPGIRSGNIAAIEAVTGCQVIPETVGQVDHISTDAEVRC